MIEICMMCVWRWHTSSLDNQTDAEPSWFVTFAPKVADEEHRHQYCHVKCAGNEPGSCAGELVPALNSWENNRSEAWNVAHNAKKWLSFVARIVLPNMHLSQIVLYQQYKINKGMAFYCFLSPEMPLNLVGWVVVIYFILSLPTNSRGVDIFHRFQR